MTSLDVTVVGVALCLGMLVSYLVGGVLGLAMFGFIVGVVNIWWWVQQIR